MRASISLLLFASAWVSALPTLAVLPVAGAATSPGIEDMRRTALEFALQKTGRFHVLTSEERAEAVRHNGVAEPGACVSSGCLSDAHKSYASDFVLGTQEQVRGAYRILRIRLQDSTGTALERWFRADSALSWLDIADGIAQQLTDSAETKLPIQTIATPDPRMDYWLWAGASALASTGYLIALWQAGYWDRQSGSLASRDPQAGSSGERGFFASPVPSARFRAMGGSGSACRHGQDCGILNPAGWSRTEGHSLQGSSSEPNDVPTRMLTFAGPAVGDWKHAAVVRTEGDPLSHEYLLAAYLANDMTTLSRWLAGLRLGVGWKLYAVDAGTYSEGEEAIRGSGSGIGMDLGLQWDLDHSVTIAVVWQDPWSSVWYRNQTTGSHYREGIPSTLRIGAAWDAPWARLYMDWDRATHAGQSEDLLAGGEVELTKGLTLRGGMRQPLGASQPVWTAGAGAMVSAQELELSADYAIELGSQNAVGLGTSHIVSVQLSF